MGDNEGKGFLFLDVTYEERVMTHMNYCKNFVLKKGRKNKGVYVYVHFLF